MSNPTEAASPPEQCIVCSRSFKTRDALQQHRIATGHRSSEAASRPEQCIVCSRSFKTRDTLQQHCIATGHRPSEASSSSLDSITCRGNTYSRLPSDDQTTIYSMLVASCHPLSRLRTQGYIVEADRQRGSSAAVGTTSTESQILPSPVSDEALPRRKAVVLDCEMAGGVGGVDELVMLTAVDFLTCEVLVNSLVKPRRPIIDWRSAVSGVRPADMSIAVAGGQVLPDWEGARSELWRHIDEDTVLIGQSLNHDLQMLRIAHKRIVDSAILTAESVFRNPKRLPCMWGLKELCADLPRLQIRDNAPRGGRVHDSLEDALAARDLVLWCLRNPAGLKTWASKTHGAFFRQKPPSRKPSGKPRTKAPRKVLWDNGDEDDSADEVLRWEDVVDYEMWPKSPPDSD